MHWRRQRREDEEALGPAILSQTLHELVRKLAREGGFRARKQDISSFHVIGGARYGAVLKSAWRQREGRSSHRPPAGACKEKGQELAENPCTGGARPR
jgi:hypothetical protein